MEVSVDAASLPEERVALGGWTAQVLTVEGHAITAVRFTPRRVAAD